MSINVTISAVNDLSKPLKIKYMQNTTAIPIVVTFTEYTIPTGSQARIYLEKTSGLKVYNNCDIKDNSIVINPSEQLFAEYGRQIAQLQIITADKKILVSKAIMFDIQEDTTSSGAIESTNEFTVLVKATEEARMSLAEANSAVARAETATAEAENSLLIAGSLSNRISDVETNKVDKVAGKGLSTNDFTDELKNKLLNSSGGGTFAGKYTDLPDKPSINGIELVGNKTLADIGVQPKGNYATEAEVANKAEKTHKHLVGDLTNFPTNVSAFNNDKNYQNASEVSAAVTNEIKKLPLNNISQATIDKFRVLGFETVPIAEYIKAEAKRVSENVNNESGSNPLRLAFTSDFHNYSGNEMYTHPDTRVSIATVDTGLIELQKYINIDGFVALGDYSWMENTYTSEQVTKDINEVMELLPVNNLNKYYCIGNHDLNYCPNRDRMMTQRELYDLVGSKSNYVVNAADPQGCYGYKDFEQQKIRMIFLNSCDAYEWKAVSGQVATSEWMSAKQINWLAETALNFNGKANPAEWGIVICSHHPLDGGTTVEKFVLEMLEGYKAGTKKSYPYKIGDTLYNIAFDFTNVPKKAEIICHIHGHNHNYNTRKISSDEATIKPWLRRFCIPNVCANRYNEVATSSSVTYKERYGEFDSAGQPVYHRKEKGTAKETTFCIVSFDRTTKKIHVNTFGAGKDEVFSYDAVSYKITTNLTNVTADGGNVATIKEDGTATLKFTAVSGYDLPVSVTVVGATSSWNRATGTLTISKPTSDVSVTIVGKAQPKYTNQLPIATDKSGAVYNGKGFKEKTSITSADGSEVVASHGESLTGFIPFGTGSGSAAKGEWILRLQNIDFDPTIGYEGICFYDANFTKLGIKTTRNMTTSAPIVEHYKMSGKDYVELDLSAASYFMKYNQGKYVKYIRIYTHNITENSIITVNEIIE